MTSRSLDHLRKEQIKALNRANREGNGFLTYNPNKAYWVGVAEGLRVAVDTLENNNE